MHDQSNIPVEKTIVELIRYFGIKLLGDCCREISLTEFLALDAIRQPGDCSVQDVGLQLGFTKSGATRLVDRLEKKDWVRKERNQADGRVCCISLTGKGFELYEDVMANFRLAFEKLATEGGNARVLHTLKALGRLHVKTK